MKASDAKRFWTKVSRGGPAACWEWTAFKRPGGYGGFNYLGGQLAHRFSYELEHGRIPSELQVLHRCDNPSCVNPRHLFLGTTQDNMDDRNDKRRHAHGERHASAVLTERDVGHIRTAMKSGARLKDLAAKFGVSNATVQQANSGRTWGHIQMGAGLE